ncbi:MAG: LysR family transcriptional regulator [Bacteroidia bacterium]|nr:LysR family transcriptional regulator [Bacteroidia bacterium]
MNYTLNQLRIFLKVVELKSITKASEELNLTQPAVSIQLKNLQDQFDIPLTEVIGKKLYVTEFGNEIAKVAQRVLLEVSEINNRTLAFKGQLVGKLKFTVVSTGKYVLPYYLVDFMNAHPGIELNVDVTNKQMVLESLEDNLVDFALVSILPTNIKVKKLDLLQNKMYLVGKTGTEPSMKTLRKDEMENLPLIYRELGSGTRQMMEKFIGKQGIVPFKRLELTSNEAVKQSILAGLGFSIMPLIGIRNELQGKELSIIPVRGMPIKTTWSLIWLEGKKHSPIAKAFIEFIKNEKSRIVEESFKWYEQYH